jgi:murein DD-endopeptidase MepM/ murein hydrolase activator NlpD
LLLPSFAFARPTASKQQLKARKANLQTKITKVKKKLQVIKQKEARTRSVLRQKEHEVRAARSSYHRTVIYVERARAELLHARQMLKSAKSNFEKGRKRAAARLVHMYQRGDEGYLDFLLSARNYSDLVQRSELTHFIAKQDRDALENLRQEKLKVAHYTCVVAEKKSEYDARRNEAMARHYEANVERLGAKKKLSNVQELREDMETELAALERDSAAVSSMLQSMQSTAAGRRRYNTVYVGRVGGLPVAGRITSGFGYRYHPVLHYRRLHTGVDIAAPTGTPIHAAGGGEVVFAGRRGGYGNAVIIDHGRGKATLYGHMSSIAVRAGQVVNGGQTIGRVGSTGISTGPHLHYEVRINGTPVNPL